MHPRFLVDLTGEGKADIVGFGDAGVYVALNNGDGTFQPSKLVLNEFGYNGGWNVNLHPRFLVDLIGNEKADIVGFGDAGVFVSYQKRWKRAELQEFIEIRLKSWKGDYLVRPNKPSGVTTGDNRIGSEWILETLPDGKIMLKSWKGDYLIRSEQIQGVTTWKTGIGSEWILETLPDGKIMLKSWKGDYLIRSEQTKDVTTGEKGNGSEWILELDQGMENEFQRVEADELNEEKFAPIGNRLNQNSEAMQAFLENPIPTLTDAEIPYVERFNNTNQYESVKMLATRPIDTATRSISTEKEEIKIKVRWWGIDVVMNKKLTQDIISGQSSLGTLSTLFTSVLVAAKVLTGPFGSVVGGIFAAAVATKNAAISIADKGNGVHWPITWLQLAFILHSGVPPLMATNAYFVLWPIRN